MKLPSFFSSLRFRLVLLILLAVLPAFAILLYNAAETRQREADKVEVDVLTLSQLAASQEELVIESARQVLLSISLLRDVRSNDTEACTTRLAELVEEYEGYTAFSVSLPTGEILCRSVPMTGPATNTSDVFQEALATKSLSVGEFALGGVSGRPVVGVCNPALNPNDEVQMVVCGGLDLALLNQRIAEMQLPPESSLLMIDRMGNVLVRYPESVAELGENLSNEPIVQAMRSQDEGRIQVVDRDGVSRFYAFTPVRNRAITGLHLAIGIPTELAFAEVNQRLLNSLILMGIVTLVTLTLAWWGSEVAVLRRIQGLIDATNKFSSGDMSARTGWAHNEGELGQLGHAFDSMATTIQQREAERRQAAQELYEQREWLRITLASIGDAVIATDMDGQVSFMNPVAQGLTGWDEKDAIGRPLTEIFVIVNADTRQTVEAPVARVIREGIIVGLANHTLLLSKDGRDIPIDDSAAPLKDDSGKLIGVVLIFRDITEREAAEEALRLSRNQLSVILEGAADGITAQDNQGRLRYANDAAARLVGYENANAMMAAPIAELMRKFEVFDENGQPFSLANLPGRRVLQTGQPASATLRYRVVETGQEHWSLVRASPVFNAHGQVELAVNIFQEITDLKQAELSSRILADAAQQLSSSLDVNRRLANVAQMAVPLLADWCAVDLLTDDNQIQRVAVYHIDPAKIQFAHELSRRYPVNINNPTGVPLVLRTGQSEFTPVVANDQLLAAATTEEARQLIRDLALSSIIIVPLVAHGRTLGALSLVWAESGRHYSKADLALAEELGRRAGLAVDNARLYDQTQQLNAELEERIRERTAQLEESQSRLRQLSAHLQAAREEERARIAREIHDELGQILTVLKIDLVSVQRMLNNPGQPVQDKLKTMLQLIDTTVQQVRRIATELRPGLLDDLGLAAAIEWQLNEFQERTEIRCEITVNLDDSALDIDSRLALFRIFQETLTNIARHSRANLVTVRLEEADKQVILIVSDNGRGITDEDIAQSRSFGLLGMRERVHLLNGTFSIQGVPGQGTTITVHLPFEKTQTQ
jgi:PAS domain S-box-containing protein